MTFRTGAESLASPSMESVNPLRRVSLTFRRRWWLEWGWQFELIWCPALYDSTLLVLKSLAQIGKEKTIWFNCRQEPVAYVNGISVTPRCLNAFTTSSFRHYLNWTSTWTGRRRTLMSTSRAQTASRWVKSTHYDCHRLCYTSILQLGCSFIDEESSLLSEDFHWCNADIAVQRDSTAAQCNHRLSQFMQFC